MGFFLFWCTYILYLGTNLSSHTSPHSLLMISFLFLNSSTFKPLKEISRFHLWEKIHTIWFSESGLFYLTQWNKIQPFSCKCGFLLPYDPIVFHHVYMPHFFIHPHVGRQVLHSASIGTNVDCNPQPIVICHQWAHCSLYEQACGAVSFVLHLVI